MVRPARFCIFNFKRWDNLKKFIGKLILALLPLLLFAGLFVKYEPNNYWGLKPPKTGNWSYPLARVRAFMRDPSEYIILGDSRMNHFDVDYVESLTGVRYANLSTGGQGPNLTRELYDWAKEKVQVQSLVLDGSFYQFRSGNRSSSALPVFYIAEHPLTYMTTRDYVVEAAELFLKDLSSRGLLPTALAAGSREAPSAVPPDKYREDLVLYATENIYPGCYNYSLDMDDYRYILQDCQESGIETRVALCPVQESIWELVIEPLHLEPFMEEYREILRQYTDVYDMEWKHDFCKNQNLFSDGFHLVDYTAFTDAIFTGEGDFLRILPRFPES